MREVISLKFMDATGAKGERLAEERRRRTTALSLAYFAASDLDSSTGC